MWGFVISRENHDDVWQDGFVVMPNGIVRIYRINNDDEEAKFIDGVVCYDLETVFELVAQMQAKAIKMKERKDEKI